MLHWLRAGPCRDAAAAFEREALQSGLLPSVADYQGGAACLAACPVFVFGVVSCKARARVGVWWGFWQPCWFYPSVRARACVWSFMPVVARAHNRAHVYVDTERASEFGSRCCGIAEKAVVPVCCCS